MIAAHVTLNVNDSRIVQYSESFSEWLNSSTISNEKFNKFFEISGYQSVEDLLFEVAQSKDVHLIKLRAQFSHNEFDTAISCLSSSLNIAGDRVSFKIIPISSQQFHLQNLPHPLFDSVNESIFICDPGGIILLANDTAQKNFDFTLEESHLSGVLYDKASFPEGITLPAALAGKTEKSSLLKGSGEQTTFEQRFYPFTDQQGYFLGFTVYIRKMEDDLTQTAEDTNPEVASIVKKVRETAHDINNIMTVVMGRLQIITFNATDEDVLKSLRSVEKSARESTDKLHKLQEYLRNIPVD